jgi:hypothetical protein
MEFSQRPPPPSLGGDIRPVHAAGVNINGRSLDELATNPASPSYRERIPPPPCHQCGEDHMPNRSYDHPWLPEPRVISADPQVQAIVAASHASPVPTAAPPPTRVAVYVGRGETYVVAVEAAPDWDATETFKVPPPQVMPLIRLARALGVRVQDKTGGDLVELEQDAG